MPNPIDEEVREQQVAEDNLGYFFNASNSLKPTIFMLDLTKGAAQ